MISQHLHIAIPDIDEQGDVDWHRQQMALQSLSISDILAEVDDLIADEPDEQKHPLFCLVANALDRRIMPGTAESLQARYGKLVDFAIERLVEQAMADSSRWED
jgi:hypothetical protein